MLIFLSSMVIGVIGFYIGIALGGNEIFGTVGGILGFSLPYALIIEKIYNLLKLERHLETYDNEIDNQEAEDSDLEDSNREDSNLEHSDLEDNN